MHQLQRQRRFVDASRTATANASLHPGSKQPEYQTLKSYLNDEALASFGQPLAHHILDEVCMRPKYTQPWPPNAICKDVVMVSIIILLFNSVMMTVIPAG